MKKIDAYTGGLLLNTAIGGDEGNNIAHTLYKEISKSPANNETISHNQKKLAALGYVPGAYVQLMYGRGVVGKIIGYNNATTGLYDAIRYPLQVSTVGGTFQYGVFGSSYEKFSTYQGKPAAFLHSHQNDVSLKLLPSQDKELLHKIMATQQDLSNMNIYQLIDFMHSYTPGNNKDTEDLIYTYAITGLEQKLSYMLQKKESFIHFVNSADYNIMVKNKEIKELFYNKFYEHIAFYNGLYGFTVGHNDLFYMYKTLTNKEYKKCVRDVMIKRAENMNDRDLYGFATIVAGSDIEPLVMKLLEQRIS